MNENKRFTKSVEENITRIGLNKDFKNLSQKWLNSSLQNNYSYNFTWLGRPIIQYPQDIVAIQELIWKIKPDLVIETGIAHGGSLIMSASILALLDLFDSEQEGENESNIMNKRKVLGIDIDIREHNRVEIEEHPLFSRIEMIEGSSTSPETISKVTKYAESYEKILLLLDSNHTHDHVLSELNAYAALVTKNSYCVVFDTIIEDMPENSFPNRNWDKGNNPKTAVWEFLDKHPEFAIDKMLESKLLITVAPNGFLKKLY